MKKLSIIVPVYNEEKTLRQIINKLLELKLKAFSKEIIIIDDSSKDKSLSIIKDLARKNKNIRYFAHPKNMGKGAALRTGFQNSTGDLITIQDGDLEYDPKDFLRMIDFMDKNKLDVIYGSRFLNKHKPRYKIYYLGNKFLSFLTKVIYGVKITDMETCYKMFKAEVIKSIPLKSNRFDIEPEITSKVIKRKFKFAEIPISYSPRTIEEGKKIGFKDGLKAIYVLLYWRFLN